MTYHKPVLVEEVISFLAPRPGGVYIDVTFGGGGHTRAILQAEPTCRVIAFDWDKDALEINAAKIEEEFPGRIQFVWSNFSQLWRQLKKLNITTVDGILADFGTSQHQISHTKGLSFATNTPLDMRLSPSHQKITAAMLINELSEKELMELFWHYGEERNARPIVHAIAAARAKKAITTTGELAQIILSCSRQNRHSIHPATRIFQALRIVVNKELDNINAFLSQAVPALKPHGRLVCISFHSLEDRLVKQFFREQKALLNILTQKVVIARPEETAVNPSARSARLRAAEKI